MSLIPRIAGILCIVFSAWSASLATKGLMRWLAPVNIVVLAAAWYWQGRVDEQSWWIKRESERRR